MFDDIPRPTCRSVYTVSDKRLRHGGSGYETSEWKHPHNRTAAFCEIPLPPSKLCHNVVSRARGTTHPKETVLAISRQISLLLFLLGDVCPSW